MFRATVRVTTPLFIAASSLVLFSPASAGDLDPPLGPVAPTPGPEPRIAINSINTPGDANSLFRIAQPGSYYLTGEVTGDAGRHGIEIGASDVSIDLMGFTLRGVPGSLDGISVDGIRNNLTVRNGAAIGWGSDGVNLVSSSSTGEGMLVEAVHVSSNGSIGLRCGNSSVVRACTAVSNGTTGIQTFENSTVESCSARSNGATGISVGQSCVIRGCTAFQNTGDGMSTSVGGIISDSSATFNGDDGFVALFGTTISRCSASFNTGDGIVGSSDCHIIDNACHSNGLNAGDGAGILITSGDNRIEGNNCSNNDRGIDVDTAGNVISRNICSGNTTNWDIVNGNICLVIIAMPSGAINGNFGGVAPGSTDPNVNFSY